MAISGNATGIASQENTVSGALRNRGSADSLPTSDPPVEAPAHASVVTMSSADPSRGRNSSSTTAAPTIEIISTIGPRWRATAPTHVVQGNVQTAGRSACTTSVAPSA